MTDIDTLIKGAKELGFEIGEEEICMFKSYKELLREWNQKFNITSITDDIEIDIKHFKDHE